jgi:hypothetical protein
MGIKRDILIGLSLFAVLAVVVSVLIGFILLTIKFIGLILLLAGMFLIVFFPGVPEDQPEEMAVLGVKIGVIVLLAGLAIMILC